MTTAKSVASLSLDLDNEWAYLKTHGDHRWEQFPSYFETAVPRFLDFMEKRKQKLTVFVVGQDAALPKNRQPLSWISQQEHEIGNHSFNHEPWLHLYTPDELEQGFEKTERAIMDVMGVKPVGFRGPGFSLSDEVLKTLMRRGYEYDCSTFPTFLGPVARAYYFMTSRLSREQRAERKELFGSFKDGFQSNRPFFWESGSDRLIEIPVTTFPILKTPIHMSYLAFLAGYSRGLAKAYFWSAVRMAKLTGLGPSLLLHPTDFLGSDDDTNMSFFPGMDQPVQRKIDLLAEIMDTLTRHFHVVPMQAKAEAVRNAISRHRSIDTAVHGVVPVGRTGAQP